MSMASVKTRSFARAGFLGNPSDGYFGKTLSFAFSNFGVELVLTESSRCLLRQQPIYSGMFPYIRDMSGQNCVLLREQHFLSTMPQNSRICPP